MAADEEDNGEYNDMAIEEIDNGEYNEIFLKVGMIYSGLSQEQVLAEAERTRKEYCYRRLELGLEKYLRNIGVPRNEHGMMAYFSEILQFGRKLSELEIDALRLKDRVTEAGEESIEIRIRGVE